MISNKKKRILLSRTVPIIDFFSILEQVKNIHPESEIYLLVQEDALKGHSQLKEYKNIIMNKGLFVYRKNECGFLNEIIGEEFDLFVLASNNSKFRGYDEFIKLAFASKIKNILLITKTFQVLKINKSTYFFNQCRKNIVHLILILSIFLRICFYVLISPFLWVRKKMLIYKFKKRSI